MCPAKTDIAVILDQSTSIEAAAGGLLNWYAMLSFTQAVINSFSIGTTLTRVGLVRFSTVASLEFPFNRYSNAPELLDAVSGLELNGGETNYAAAFRVANTQLLPNRRPEVKAICIFITDGQPNMEVDLTFTEVNKTKELGCEIYAVGVTANVSIDFRGIILLL